MLKNIQHIVKQAVKREKTKRRTESTSASYMLCMIGETHRKLGTHHGILKPELINLTRWRN